MDNLDSEYQTTADLLADDVESPSDVAEGTGSLLESSGLNDGQSDSLTEQVAPDAENESIETDDEVLADATSELPSAEAPIAAAVDWDSAENPYLESHKALEAVRQYAAQQQAEAQEKETRERWSKAFQSLPDLDEDDIPALTDELISDIQTHAQRPYAERIDVLEHGLTAVVAALEAELSPEQVEAVKKRAALTRDMAANAKDLHNAVQMRRAFEAENNQEKAALQKQITNLKAQLAAKVITDSGVNKSETVAVGATGNEITSWSQLLEGRI